MQVTEFRIGNSWFAVDVLDIQEVSNSMKFFKIPQAPDYIQGFVNLRGQVCTVVALKNFFKIHSESQESMNVIASTDYGMVAYEVDEIGDVLQVDDELLKEVPETIPDEIKNYIKNILVSEGKKISFLDIKAISQNILNKD